MINKDELKHRIIDITKHPQMCCGTPEAAHGELVAYLTVWLTDTSDIPLTKASREIYREIDLITSHVLRANSQKSLLCDIETFPEHRVSFDEFRHNATKLLKRLGVIIE